MNLFEADAKSCASPNGKSLDLRNDKDLAYGGDSEHIFSGLLLFCGMEEDSSGYKEGVWTLCS